MIKRALPVLMIFLLSACSVSRTPQGTRAVATLEHTHWVLAAIKGRPAVEDGSGSQAFIELHPAILQFSGNTGLNAFSGTYSKTRLSVRFSIEVAAEATGSEQAEAQNRDLLGVLAAAQTFSIDRRELQLKVDGTAQALFVAK